MNSDYPIRQIFQDHQKEIWKMPLNDAQRQAARMIAMCRTEELGFSAAYCPNCGKQLHYISCNNRNCPCCQWSSQQEWILLRENEVIAGIPYYHIILTVPHELNPLILLNESLLLGKLFSCSSRAVIDLCGDRRFLGVVPGIISVLHTWRQDLLVHYHIHMIVSGGGLNTLGQFIVQRDPSRNRKKQPEFEGGFFLPMAALQPSEIAISAFGRRFLSPSGMVTASFQAPGRDQKPTRCCSSAKGPMRAIFFTFLLKGSRPEFFRSTALSSAARRAISR